MIRLLMTGGTPVPPLKVRSIAVAVRPASRRSFLVSIWCLFVILLLPGCQRKDSSYRIVVIPKGMTHEFWQSIRRGAERAAADFKEEGIAVDIIWDGPLREKDILDQISIVDRRIATGVDGIVLAPQHSQILSAPVKRAREEGIPVVIIDSGLSYTDGYIKYVATDNYNGGWMAADHLARTLAPDGTTELKLILLRYQVGSESTEQREQGFLDYFDPLKNDRLPTTPKVHWLSTNQYAGATRDSASRVAGPLVQQFKDQADAIFAPNESSASGVLDVLRSLDLHLMNRKGNRKIHLMAFDSSQPLLQAIAEGNVDGSILQDPYYMGYLSVDTLVRYLKGADVNKGRTEMSVSTTEYLVTPLTINDPDTVKRFDPAKQAQRDMRRERMERQKK